MLLFSPALTSHDPLRLLTDTYTLCFDDSPSCYLFDSCQFLSVLPSAITLDLIV